MKGAAISLCAFLAAGALFGSADSGDFVVKDFRFATGETLPEVRIHYRTIGNPRKDGKGAVRNAVLLLHGTTGSGKAFLADNFAGVLFGPGQLLDASKCFLGMPDGIGHGESTKPSDGLRARFPRYTYEDMITAQYRLVTEGVHIDHLRLLLGTSMGGMHAWMWGEKYPSSAGADANDFLYAFEASREYDPSAGLEKITAPVLAINSADDVVNPPELGLMEKLIPRVSRGRYILIPTGPETRDHGTHSWPAVWQEHLKTFLAELPAD
jgi:homoserine acetyltransferase